jgi:hypothetical protein
VTAANPAAPTAQKNLRLSISSAADPGCEAPPARAVLDFEDTSVVYAFRTFLGRDPAPSGLAFWSGQLESGLTPEQFARALYDSPEFQSTHAIASLDDTQFVDLMFRLLRRTPPTSSGLAFWVGCLAQGSCTRDDLVDQLIQATSFRGAHVPMFCAQLVPTPGVDPDLPFCTEQVLDPSDTIDTLDFLLSNHPDTRIFGMKQGFVPNHGLNYHVIGSDVYAMKWQSPEIGFELYTWDGAAIYLREDHSGPNPPTAGQPLQRWMDRTMYVGESFEVSDALQIRWADLGCSSSTASPWPYQMVLERHEPRFIQDWIHSGRLGVQDVIVLLYYYYAGNYERFFYSREWGLIRHEKYLDYQLALDHATTYYDRLSSSGPIPPGLAQGQECTTP